MDGQSPRGTWKRRLVRALVVLLVLTAGLVAALPWIASTPPARRALVSALNRALAPTRVEIDGLSVSWTGPGRLTGLRLTSSRGKRLVDAPTATIGRGLLALAVRPGRIGAITLEGAAIDLERRADGSIDLVEALVPSSSGPSAPASSSSSSAPRAELDVTLRVRGGRLTLRTPELAGPLEAGKFDMEAHLPSSSAEVLSWRIRLASPPAGSDAETLGVDGTYDHRAAAGADLTLQVKGQRWPLALAGESLGADLTARARLDGQLRLERKGGRWSTSGDASLAGLDATGRALAGDRLRLDAVTAAWDLEQKEGAWSLRQVKLKSPVAELFGRGESGTAASGPSARVEATADLAALARQVPRAMRLREGLTLERGNARFTAELASQGANQTLTVDGFVGDLAAREGARAFTLRDPASISARGTRTPTGLSVSSLTLKAASAELKGSGDLERGLSFTGGVDLAALQAQFRDLIDFGGVEVAGRARMAADYRRAPATTGGGAAYVARYAAEVRDLKLVGLAPGPLVRPTARVDAAATGPADASGLPRGWTGVRANLKSSHDNLAVTASQKDGDATLSATVALPLSALPSRPFTRDGQAGLKFAGRWKEGGQTVVIDELGLSLVPADPKLAADGTLALSVRGRLDLGADTLVLASLPAAAGKPAPLALAQEGLSLKGLRSTPLTQRAGRIMLTGDLAALDRAKAVWTDGQPSGLAGRAGLQLVYASGGAEVLLVGAQLQVPDLSRPGPDARSRRPEGPLSLTVRGRYEPAPDRLTLDEVAGVTRYASIAATGRLDGPTGPCWLDLSGTLAPVWPNLSALAAETIEPGLTLTGGPRAFHLRGPIAGASLAAVLKGLDAELGLELASADAFGLKLGPAPLVVRCSGGTVRLDPIATTLNGGRVDLKAGFDVDETRGIALIVDPGSSITDAAINDEVSHRLLRYVAPVLDQATQVNGKISLQVAHGEFPLTGPPERRANMTGRLTFQDVVFAPGPFASEVLALAGQPNGAGLKLRQPVELSIADGRVVQKGLDIPVRQDLVVGVEGSVGFDQTLDLRASVPLSRALLGSVPGLEKLAAGQRVTVPIGGTVTQPRINRQALQVALKELSRGMLRRELTERASGLLDQLAPPPAAAPAAAAEGQPAAPADPLKALQGELLKRLAPRLGGPQGGRR